MIKDIGFLIKRCTCQHRVSQSKFHNSNSNENGEKSPGKHKISGTNMLNNVSHRVAETKAEAIQTIITSQGTRHQKICWVQPTEKGQRAPHLARCRRALISVQARHCLLRQWRAGQVVGLPGIGGCQLEIPGHTIITPSGRGRPRARVPRRPHTTTHTWTCPCRISAAARAHVWRHHASPHDPTRALSPSPTYPSAVRASKTPAGNEVRSLPYRKRTLDTRSSPRQDVGAHARACPPPPTHIDPYVYMSMPHIRGSARACVAASPISARPHPCTLPFPYVRECGQGVEDARRQRGQVVVVQVEMPGHTIITRQGVGAHARAYPPTPTHIDPYVDMSMPHIRGSTRAHV